MARSESLKRAQKEKRERDRAANPVKYRHDTLMYSATSFVRNHANAKDMIELNRIYREESTGGDSEEQLR